jgi:hypothetical protein
MAHKGFFSALVVLARSKETEVAGVQELQELQNKNPKTPPDLNSEGMTERACNLSTNHSLTPDS